MRTIDHASKPSSHVFITSVTSPRVAGGVLVRVLVLVLVFVRREVAMLCIAGCEPLI